MVTLKEIRAILAVSRTGSFVGAARSLRLTQASVSKLVASAEKELGTQLFVRTTYGVLVTDDGDYVISYAEKIEWYVKEILNIGQEPADELEIHKES